MTIPARHPGQDIEAGGTGVAGLDTVHAFDFAEKTVVITDRLAVITEGRRREIAIVARETILDGTAQRRLFTRGSHLFVVRQAGGIAIDRARHAEGARLAGH